jgi:glycosyltransferase involved in cell wall biosynthesis
MRTALIFRSELLPLSETFIRSQAEGLQGFHPRYAGIQYAKNGLPVPADSIVVMRNESIAERLRRRLFIHTGWEPRLYRELRDSVPALIHAHFAPDGAAVLPLVPVLRVPLIVTLHGYDVTWSEDALAEARLRFYPKRKKQLLETAAVFICVSEFIRQSAIKAGYPESKLRVHYIGVDRKRFAPPVGLRECKRVLFVGRLVEKKGCASLINAMQIVQSRCREAELVVIGDGPLRLSLETLASRKGIFCRFLGSQPAGVVRHWLSRARVFSVPSVTARNGDSEGLGMVFAEAQAMGVPVASFLHGGIPEVVLNGETGLLAPEGDYKVLAEHLLRYLEDESFWRECSKRGPEWIEQRFDLYKQTRELEAIYNEVARGCCLQMST